MSNFSFLDLPDKIGSLEWYLKLILGIFALLAVLYRIYLFSLRASKVFGRKILIIGKIQVENSGNISKCLINSGFIKKEKIEEVKTFENGDISNYADEKYDLIVYVFATLEELKNVIEFAKNKKAPLIIYAKGNALSPESYSLIGSYPYASVSNFFNRLINDIFVTLLTFKEK